MPYVPAPVIEKLCFIEGFLLIMKKNIKIHGSLKSANFRKVVAVARYLGIEYSHASNDVYKGEGQTESYLSINKLGQIPTLVVDNDIITESTVILSQTRYNPLKISLKKVFRYN